ncbi:hypothetical protein AB0N29_19965 [Nocardioides sp. NPDC092400]|uniref:hypothetical protein n=1 Tax=Nocardioides sp. NPDC092400 TaxID=3155196 RepID=UPI00342432AE
MSKMDNLRALREARYEQDRAARAGSADGAVRAPAEPRTARPTGVPGAVVPARKKPAARKPAADPAGGAAPSESACGHRAISGRTCTRPLGHAEKNHRYS